MSYSDSLISSISVNCSALFIFCLPEMTIVRLCNVPLQLKLVADVANFCGQWPYIEYLVMSYSSAVKFDLGQFY
jgi:hypothetical protein